MRIIPCNFCKRIAERCQAWKHVDTVHVDNPHHGYRTKCKGEYGAYNAFLYWKKIKWGKTHEDQ